MNKDRRFFKVSLQWLLCGFWVGGALAALPVVEERNSIEVMQVKRPTSVISEDVRIVRPGVESVDSNHENPTLNLLSKIDFLQQEVQELRGKFEEQSYQIEQMHKRQKDLYLDLDKRIRTEKTAGNQVGGVSLDTLAESQAQTRGQLKGGADQRLSAQIAKIDLAAEPVSRADTIHTPMNAQDKAAEERAYQVAYQYIQAKDFSRAETALKSMLKSFPEGEYAPNGHYWLGELYLVGGNLDLAQTQFENVYQNYPTHQKAADALLKMGYVQYAKGQWQRSSELLGQVKTRFPHTSSARLADSRLERMRQDGHL